MDKAKKQRHEGFDMLSAVLVILKRKKLVASIVALVVIVTAVISLVVNPVYRAESQILPPQSSNGSMANRIFSQIGGAASVFMPTTVGIKNSNDLFAALLKTRTVLDKTVSKFNLMEVYGSRTREDARGKLDRDIEVANDKKSGILTVRYKDTDPERSAAVVNYLVTELKALNSSLAVTEAAQRRLFFETQLKSVKETLIHSEEELKGFQEKTGVFKIDDQTKVMVESIAKLRAQIAAKEVQLKVVRSYQMEENPELRTLATEISGLGEQLRKLESKSGRSSGYDSPVPTRKMPAVGLEYVRKMREFKYNEALFGILLKELESAKLDESRDSSVIQVIENAVPPEKRFSPRRTRMVVIAFILGSFLSLFAAFMAEYLQRLCGDPANGERLEAIRSQVFFWRN